MTRQVIVLHLMLGALFCLTIQANAEKRVALVIGNSDYKHTSRLANPVNDATIMATTLRGLGFKVSRLLNAKQKTIKQAMRDFGRSLRGSDAVGLFYYAGHGVQVGGQNYLIPVDANITDESEVDFEGISVNAFLGTMRRAKSRINIVILDACRDNPYASTFRSTSRGLGRVTAPRGTLIAYATAPGNVAADGDSGNSPYTAALVAAMAVPGNTIERVFKQARAQVLAETNDVQIPWETSSITGEFYFTSPKDKAVGQKPAVADGILSAEETLWNSIKSSNNKSDFEFYLNRYPKGRFSDVAALRIQKLAAVSPPPKPKVEKPVKPAIGVYPPKVEPKRFPFKPEMVRIPGGTFRMGCVSGKSCVDDEKPVHRVTVKAFEMGKYEVTFAEWDACVDDGGCKHKPEDEGWGRGKRPVINVSWDDITKQYIPWLNRKTGKTYRLPTEAEWEYAARAKTKTTYWWGNKASHQYANYGTDECCDGLAKGADKWKHTSPVGSFPNNAFGVYDMHGNVWEWVQDCWHDSYKNAPSDGSAWLKANGGECDKRVLRGGSWGDIPRYLRSANRNRIDRGIRDFTVGFRLSRTLE